MNIKKNILSKKDSSKFEIKMASEEAGKRILIFESDKVYIERFSLIMKNKSYEYAIVSDKMKSKDFIDNIEKIIEEEQPDYVIIGNVYGKNFDVAEKVKKAKPEINPIFYIGDTIMIKKAREKGYDAFRRKIPLEEIFEIVEEKS